MKAKAFTGTGVALITPFDAEGNIDFPALGKLLSHVMDGGVDFLVALGTTSEAPVLSSEEKKQVLTFIKEENNGKLPLVVGLGGNNTQSIVDSIKSMDFNGIDGILSVAPYYNKPNQRGLYQHFAAIANASPVPIILYNVPGRTSSNILAETTLKLAHDFDNIVAVKEASGDLIQIMEIIRDKPKDFAVLSGDDALTFPMMTLGSDGVISVVANAFPQKFSSMVKLAEKGEIAGAAEIHYELLEIIQVLFEDGNPAGVKAALEMMEIAANNLRLPLVCVNEATYKKLSRLINK